MLAHFLPIFRPILGLFFIVSFIGLFQIAWAVSAEKVLSINQPSRRRPHHMPDSQKHKSNSDPLSGAFN